ncbi:YfjI family protein [Streptosporangium sp. NPDC006930]|uniref:YfjI family protein n=1 Tax=Streptosporangium sp. NPDC006930 TaxID=3154783 RepID=UPI003426BF31
MFGPLPAPSDDWDDPVPLGVRTALPDFPTDAFPAYIAAMIRGVAEEIQVPEDLPGGLALAVLATAAGGRAEVLVRGQWREPVNLQIGIAMPPGSGKSPGFRMMLRPVFAAETALQEAAKEQIKEIEKEQRDAMARAEAARKLAKTEDEIAVAMDAVRMAEEMEIPVKPRLTADDVVPEQAATILAEQGGRLAILSAEGSFFEIVMGRYSGKPNLELVLKGHAGDRLQVDRRGREEFVERPALTMGICLQPQLLQDIAAKKQMAGRGALARLLFAVPPDKVGFRNTTPDLLDEGVIRDYNDTIMGLIIGLSAWTDPAIIVLTPAALKLHTEWRTEIEPRLRRGTGDLEALREWAAKLAGHTVRLAGLLHLAENPARGAQMPIGEDTMGRAIDLAKYYAEHAMAAFGVMRAHPLLDKAHAVLEWIGERKDFKPRDVHRAMHRRFDGAEEVSAVLRLLEDHGYIRQAEVASTGGRKPVVYHVSPKGW